MQHEEKTKKTNKIQQGITPAPGHFVFRRFLLLL